MRLFSRGRGRHQVGTVTLIIGLQIAITLAAGFFVWVMSADRNSAVSALMGGAIGLLPGLVYLRVIRAAEGQSANALVKAHYLGQALKFAVTVVLFGATFFLASEVAPLPLFLTYIATLLAYWGGLIRYQDRYPNER